MYLPVAEQPSETRQMGSCLQERMETTIKRLKNKCKLFFIPNFRIQLKLSINNVGTYKEALLLNKVLRILTNVKQFANEGGTEERVGREETIFKYFQDSIYKK